jgi:hypothetical protein
MHIDSRASISLPYIFAGDRQVRRRGEKKLGCSTECKLKATVLSTIVGRISWNWTWQSDRRSCIEIRIPTHRNNPISRDIISLFGNGVVAKHSWLLLGWKTFESGGLQDSSALSFSLTVSFDSIGRRILWGSASSFNRAWSRSYYCSMAGYFGTDKTIRQSLPYL